MLTTLVSLGRLRATASCGYRWRSLCALGAGSRTISTLQFEDVISRASSKYQIYVSQLDDPFTNLSIEHHLFQKSHPDSTVLFLYINRPCVVIGRNQNPWLETNLAQLKSRHHDDAQFGKDALLGRPDLVRRRSGGGTVFHDHGNVNWSVSSPPAGFNRDKYAEVVARAIREENPRARVNERHDIVLDQGPKLQGDSLPPSGDWHRSSFEPGQPLKVSGSAYKLTRTRTLHHGTCLVNTPNIGRISQFLRSPAAPFLKANGVDSVRSPVGNISSQSQPQANENFVQSVIRSFVAFHGLDQNFVEAFDGARTDGFLKEMENGVCGSLDESITSAEGIRTGEEELKSLKWTYGQTPSFTLSTHPTEEDPRPRPALPKELSSSTRITISSRSGQIQRAEVSLGGVDDDYGGEGEKKGSARSEAAANDGGMKNREKRAADQTLQGRHIEEIATWHDEAGHLRELVGSTSNVTAVADWLDVMFGKRATVKKRSDEK